jgi:hypothetical protein
VVRSDGQGFSGVELQQCSVSEAYFEVLRKEATRQFFCLKSSLKESVFFFCHNS